MKKLTLLFAFVLLLFSGVFAQTGADCSTPDVVTALPYTATGLTTAGSGNDYLATVCGSDYMTGEDYVFTYTPGSNQNVSITLTNTDAGVGLFVMDDCPDATPTCVDYVESTFGNPQITNVALSSGTTYYIIVSTYDFMGFNPNSAFDIEILELLQYDAGVVEITEPVSGCGLSNSETVSVVIRNNGILQISNFDVSYTVNGGAAVTETVAATIDPDSLYLYTFTQGADLSTPSTYYYIEAYTELSGDGDNNNDTFMVAAANLPQINTFPYTQDFETQPDWFVAFGAGTTWELATPAATLINSAASGSYSWVTNPTGNHSNGEISYLVTPCFDFTSLTKPSIGLNIWYETTIVLGNVILEYSTDNGASWDTLTEGSSFANWYGMTGTWSGSSAGWLAAYNVVPALGGESNVAFRVKLDGGFIAAEGVAVDDFHIEDCNTPDPVADFSYVINGTSVDFTNASTGATSYSWDFGNFIGSSTDASPTYDFMIDGSYTVTMIAMNQCGADTSIQIIDIVTSVNNPAREMIRVYPNPANDNLVIEDANGAVISYAICNPGGQVILNGQKGGSIDISALKAGAYILKIQTASSVFNRKLIVE